ncbi:MAG: hypothetical protein FWH15_06065 [Betaproteobacteria bacterium]|nr:hypothetical protein [Betaproteobacteria bacterium]
MKHLFATLALLLSVMSPISHAEEDYIALPLPELTHRATARDAKAHQARMEILEQNSERASSYFNDPKVKYAA